MPRCRRLRSRFHVTVFAGALAGGACADGKFFAPPGYPSPVIPGQRAAIILDGGTETMVVDTDLVGHAGDLAWIIPTPQPAEVLPVERGVMETLELVTGPTFVPRPIERSELVLGICIVALATGWVVIAGRWGAVCGAAALALAVTSVLLLPALATAGSAREIKARDAGAKGDEVEILSQGMAGDFEFTVLRSADGSALAEWLVEQGFAVPDAARPVIEWHVAQGWSFVAGRLGREALAAREKAKDARTSWRPHPVALRFATTEAVYPMRLTGVGEASILLRLFVLADSAVSCAVLDRAAVLPIARRVATDPPTIDMPRSECALGHPAVLAMAPKATTITRLEGTLLPEHLATDVRLKPDRGARPHRDVRWRVMDRRREAFWASVALGTPLLLVVGVVLSKRSARGPRAWPWATAALAAAAVAGAVLHLRGAEHERTRRLEGVLAANLAAADKITSLARGTTPTPDLVATLREVLGPGFAQSINRITGGYRREEASPGNWQLAWTDGRVE